jgi:hypothetical protein
MDHWSFCMTSAQSRPLYVAPSHSLQDLPIDPIRPARPPFPAAPPAPPAAAAVGLGVPPEAVAGPGVGDGAGTGALFPLVAAMAGGMRSAMTTGRGPSAIVTLPGSRGKASPPPVGLLPLLTAMGMAGTVVAEGKGAQEEVGEQGSLGWGTDPRKGLPAYYANRRRTPSTP